MAFITGKIGLGDLALGEGTETQDLGNGHVRTIEKINAGNLPFSGVKTLKQAIDEFNILVASAEVLNVTQNKVALKTLAGKVSQLTSIYSKLDKIQTLADKANVLDTLQQNLNVIQNLHNTIVKTEQAVADAKYRECKMSTTEVNINKKIGYLTNLCNQDILPMKSQLDMLLEVLTNKIDTIKAELVLGNEMAHKLGTYTWDLKVVRACKVPRFFVDDANNKIQLIMPQPICANTLPTPNAQYVQDSVNTYLATLPNLGGGGGLNEANLVTQEDIDQIVGAAIAGAGGAFDEAVTQEEINQAIA